MRDPKEQEMLLEAFVLSNRIDRARIALDLPEMKDTQRLSEILDYLVSRDDVEEYLRKLFNKEDEFIESLTPSERTIYFMAQEGDWPYDD